MNRSQALAPKPDIPDDILARWQEIVDLTAEIVEVPAALINRFEPEYIEILATSSKSGNPYKPGDRASLAKRPYCSALRSAESMFLLRDAREDPTWSHGAATEHGMIAYLGLALRWPDGDLFGTICVMDSKKNEFTGRYQRLLGTLKNLVDSDLRSLMQAAQSTQAAHTRLQESEEKFATAFHESPIPMVISTFDDARLIDVNREFEKIVGYSAKEVIGQTALKIGLWFDPRDREFWIDELRHHGTVHDVEVLFRTRAGERIYCNTTASVVSIGGERCLLTAVEDVTEQRRVERALRQSEERYRSFVENFSGIAYQGKDFIPHFFHGDVEGVTGYKEEDFLAGSPKWNEIVHPDDRGVFTTEDEQKLHAPGGHAYERKYRIVRKDNRVVWVRENIQSVCDEKGSLKHVQGTIQDITERKQAEEALKENEEFMRTVLDSVADGILAVDSQGRIVHTNRRFADMWRIPQELIDTRDNATLIQHVLDQLIDPDSFLARVKELYGSIKEDFDLLTFKDGKIFERYSYPLVMQSAAVGRVWSFRDVTESWRAQRQLRDEKERAQRYLDIAETFLLALDRDGRISLINRKGCDILGYDEPELLGENWFEFCLPVEDCASVRVVFESLMSGNNEHASQYENFVQTKEGERRLVFWHNTLLRDRQGRITGTLSSGEDISDRKRTEDALRASERKFRAVFDQSFQLTGLLSLDGTVLEVNKMALEMAGVEAADVIGKPYFDTPWWRSSSDGQAALKGAFSKAVLGEVVHLQTTHLDARGRAREIDATLGPLLDDSGEVVGVIPLGFDITERKQAEREVLASREALRVLAAELSTAEERERRRIASNLHDRLGQALAVLRMKFGSLTAADDEAESTQLIAEIRDLLEKAIEDTSTLTFDLSPPILYELGVEAAIEWAGENLCSEHELSFEFSDDGRPKPLEEDVGPLLYRCARELMMNVVKHAEASKLKVEVGRDGDVVSIAVEDDGAGFVPPEGGEGVHSHNFGLYSIKERIKHLGGTFHIESKPGGGTRAMVSAPIREPSSEGTAS
jgi:PAS domain S-box-containing protein